MEQIVRLVVFTVVNIQIAVFRVVTTSSFMLGYQSLGGPCCLHLQVIEQPHYTEQQSPPPQKKRKFYLRCPESLKSRILLRG